MAVSLTAVRCSVQYKPSNPPFRSLDSTSDLGTHLLSTFCQTQHRADSNSLPFSAELLGLFLVGLAFKKRASFHYQILYLIPFTRQLRTHLLCKDATANHSGQRRLRDSMVFPCSHSEAELILPRSSGLPATLPYEFYFHKLQWWSCFL